ncbi:RNA methyltransferase [Neisseriaceae bacterium PsAf]|nr:RNA methyltransferase [Neisseriaceae bacterium PsAf]MCV2502560.1 RNA methyltransferase [Neisseriaceae bacterium]
MHNLNIITSRQNQHIKYLINLFHSGAFRKKQREYVIEGIHLLQNAPFEKIKAVFITESRIQHPEIKPILADIPAEKVFYISDELANKISDLTSSKEIIAIVNMPTQPEVATIQEDCILLDRVQDPGNIGTIIRTAVACCIKHVLLSKGCADVYMPKVLRATMGAHFKVNLYPNTNLLNFVKEYPHNVLVTQLSDSAKNLYTLNLTEINAWVFGNEGAGIIEDFKLVKNAKKQEVYVPMIGDIESLNVAIATSVCMFEQLRQRLY